MRRVALKGLWWRRGRAVLTAFAVVLGVAMVSGTFILTDTINKAFDAIFQDSYSDTSAVISGPRGRQGRRERQRHRAAPRCSIACAPTTSVAEATGAIFNLSGTSDATKLIGKRRRGARLEQQRAVRLRLRPGCGALQPACR